MTIAIIAALVIALLGLPAGVAIFLYRKVFGVRTDTLTSISTPRFAAFPSLVRRQVQFPSAHGVQLTGYVYEDPSVPKPKALVVLSHGLTGSMRTYYDDIQVLCAHGYRVLAYDNTGCDKSGGTSMRGLPQSAVDLRHALQFLQTQPDLCALPLCLYGHSWGGYAVASVLNDDPPVCAVVSRSGFHRSMDMLMEKGKRYMGPFLALAAVPLYLYEWCLFGTQIFKTGGRGLAHTRARALVLYSDDDPTIGVDNSLYGHRKQYADNANVQVVLLHGKGHDVVRSDRAIAYRKRIQQALRDLDRQYKGRVPQAERDRLAHSFDGALYWERDDAIWQTILSFLDGAVAACAAKSQAHK